MRLHFHRDDGFFYEELPCGAVLIGVAEDEGSIQGPGQGRKAGPLRVEGVARGVSWALKGHFMTFPQWFRRVDDMPRHTQAAVFEGEEGKFAALVPVLDGDYCTTAGGMEGGVEFLSECGPLGRPQARRALAVWRESEDGVDAVMGAVRAAVRWMGRGRLREEKRTPDWIERVGWCTWDAFYTDVDEARALEGLQRFAEAGFVPGWMILDEGWQDYDAKHFLRSFGAKVGAFSGNRLSHLVARAKGEFGLWAVGCWRTLFGELRGVSTEGGALEIYRPKRVRETGTETDEFGVVAAGEVENFQEDYCRSLAEDGVGMVKVDFQSALPLMTYEQEGRVAAQRRWQYALQGAVERHLGGQLLNCMAMGAGEVFHSLTGNVVRSSEDFFPGKDEAHPSHVRQNLWNGVWLSPVQWCDWDMFQSEHAWAKYHAVARAVSGGPVYVSDQPGKTDAALLKRFVAADGRVLRCGGVGLPFPGDLLVDVLSEGRALRGWNRCGELGVVAVFHPSSDPAATPVIAEVRGEEIPGLSGRTFAVWSVERGWLGLYERQGVVTVSLGPREADLLVFSPMANGFAALGLVEKWNPAAAVLGSRATDAGVEVQARGGGRFAVFSSWEVASVTGDDGPLAFSREADVTVVDTGDRPDLTMRFQRAE